MPSNTEDEDLVIEDIKVETQCPQCAAKLVYDAQLEGTRALCKACKHIFTISFQPTPSKPSQTSPSDSFPFECPACHKLFEGKRELIGKKGKCEQCQTVFQIAPIALSTSTQSDPSTQQPVPKKTSHTEDTSPRKADASPASSATTKKQTDAPESQDAASATSPSEQPSTRLPIVTVRIISS